ncbi:MAG: acyltransferase [Nitrosomonadales bacterium]|nr:acyltransferase [Nitrosomonadales bacterium]
MRLSNFTQGRDNNFNLIRIVAAFSVLITHSFALATGRIELEPLRTSLGMTMGHIAVNVFFIASGFLVSASLLTRQNVIEFVWARALRIFPALLVMLLVTVFGFGVFFTSLPVSSYLASDQVYLYLLKCATLITNTPFYLPGVFDKNPYWPIVNGSIWTLPYEIRMYAILAVFWLLSQLARDTRIKAFKIIVLLSFILSGALSLFMRVRPAVIADFSRMLGVDGNSVLLFFMFFSGAAFYVLKERIVLSARIFWVCLIALVSAAFISKGVFFVIYLFTIAYLLFYAAFVPGGWIRQCNRVGDYSYGVYIYAFPVQQSIAALFPRITVSWMIFFSAAVSILLAMLSWHFIERRALELKGLAGRVFPG